MSRLGAVLTSLLTALMLVTPIPVDAQATPTPSRIDDSSVPVELELEVLDRGGRWARVEVGCNRRSVVAITAALWQSAPSFNPDFPQYGGGREAGASRHLHCRAVHRLRIPLPPRVSYGRGGPHYPVQRLVPGPAEFTVWASTDSGPTTSVTVSEEVTLSDPTLRRRLTFDHGGVVGRLIGIRITGAGAATARVELDCRLRSVVTVSLQTFAPAPGDTYRTGATAARPVCEPDGTTVDLPLRPLPSATAEHAIPAGRMETYLRVRAAGDWRYSLAMRPVTTRRPVTT